MVTGIGFKHAFMDWFEMTAGLDFARPDNKFWAKNTGIEFLVNKHVAIRMGRGSVYGEDSRQHSFGLGLKSKHFYFDYYFMRKVAKNGEDDGARVTGYSLQILL